MLIGTANTVQLARNGTFFSTPPQVLCTHGLVKTMKNEV